MNSPADERRRRTRTYFIAQSVVGAAIVNALINAGFGWLAMLTLPSLPLWGAPSVAIDTVLTAFGIAVGTALIVPVQAKKDLFAGKVSPDEPSGQLAALIRALPDGVLSRGVMLGAGCVLAFAPMPIVALSLLGVEALLPGPFLTFKALFAAVVGAAITPLITLHAMVTARGRAWPADLTG